nr:hypothetical 36.7K protein - Trypanosoma cruzi [Trypanosoma cruzi]
MRTLRRKTVQLQWRLIAPLLIWIRVTIVVGTTLDKSTSCCNFTTTHSITIGIPQRYGPRILACGLQWQTVWIARDELERRCCVLSVLRRMKVLLRIITRLLYIALGCIIWVYDDWIVLLSTSRNSPSQRQEDGRMCCLPFRMWCRTTCNRQDNCWTFLLDHPVTSHNRTIQQPHHSTTAGGGDGQLPQTMASAMGATNASTGGNVYRSSLADQWLTADAAARRNIETRWEQAALCLTSSERHLENFASVLGIPVASAADNGARKSTEYGDTGVSGSGGVAGVTMDEGRSQHTLQLACLYRELNKIRQYLTSQQEQVETAMRMRGGGNA